MVKNRILITSWNNSVSAPVWAPIRGKDEQAWPSVGRFISVSLDKPTGHHSIGMHVPCYWTWREKKADKAIHSDLLWKKTEALNEPELSLLHVGTLVGDLFSYSLICQFILNGTLFSLVDGDELIISTLKENNICMSQIFEYWSTLRKI